MITCSSCGARISKTSDQCSSCGWLVGAFDHDMQGDKNRQVAESPKSKSLPQGQQLEDAADASGPSGQGLDNVVSGGPFCHMCGWENPAGARFCSSCGTQLQAVKPGKQATLPQKPASQPVPAAAPVHEETASESSEAPDSEPEPAQVLQPLHIGMVAIAGLLGGAALYMITTFSRRAFPEVEQAPSQAQSESARSTNEAPPLTAALPPAVTSRIEAIEAEAEGLQGDDLVQKKREIVSILASEGRPDKAAPVQEEIAQLAGTSNDWFQAGHFFYDWMDSESGEQRFNVALQAVSAYEKGLELDPDDLNIRTALAMAYLNTRAPMQGVQQIRQVLDTDPDHLQGNFYYGVMLLQINRTDQARTQFARVKELVGPESPVYQQADMMLQNLDGVN